MAADRLVKRVAFFAFVRIFCLHGKGGGHTLGEMKFMVRMFVLTGAGFLMSAMTPGAVAQDIALPAPVKSGGMPLNEALAKRATKRAFSDRELELQALSNLLWAANGVTRPDGKRTAPTARNLQELELIVLLRSGAYAYDAAAHKLVQVSKENLIPVAGGKAPVEILIIGDKNKQPSAEYRSVDSGFIGQNIYLFCTSAGLSSVFRGSVDRSALEKKLSLGEDKVVTYSHSVGYPAE